MKKSLLFLGAVVSLALTGCSREIKINPDKEKYLVGIAQYGPHPALDAATNGFKTKLKSLLKKAGRKVEYKVTNAAGEVPNCATIVNSLVSKDVDLIMANATPCVSAAYTATSTIPILGTSVTEYGVALDVELKDGATGTNVSGTSDLAPLKTQVDIMTSLLPAAKKFGILYCSEEANSKYQVQEVKKYLNKKGLKATEYAISGTDTLNAICNSAKSKEDAIYIPTDNFCATNSKAIASAFGGTKPIFAGEEGICKACGFATLTIDYYRLGEITGEMAYNVLLGKKDIRKYAIQYDPNPVKKYVKSRCTALGIEIPEGQGYEEIIVE